MNNKAGELLGTGRVHSLSALARLCPQLVNVVESRPHKEQLLDVRVNDLPVTLSLRSTTIRTEDGATLLLAIQDIREALDNRELESWTRLIRILTHEIMNSVTPITSLSESMSQQLARVTQAPGMVIADDQLKDLSFSLKTIHRRGEGLLSFVADYRKFTQIGIPSIKKIDLNSFVNYLTSLFQEEFQTRDIKFTVELPHGKMIFADEVLLEQAVINLIRNAMDALENKSEAIISFQYSKKGDFDCLSISDNGPGIPANELKEVFVPFFTTKPSGSGIGLSLSRQILHAHGGTIDLTSIVNEGTKCSLFLPSRSPDESLQSS